MAPFNFAQRSSSRTAAHAPVSAELKVQNLDLNASSVKEASLPPSAARYSSKPPHLSGTFEPSKAFVRQLATKSEYRSGAAHCAPPRWLVRACTFCARSRNRAGQLWAL